MVNMKPVTLFLYLGIEFYLFVSRGGMNDRGSTCKFRNARSAFRNLHVDPLSLHTSMRYKQVEFNPYIYALSKLYRFGYEISVLIQNTRSLFYGRHYSSLHRLMSLHGKLNVKIFLMFIVAENTRSVNIYNYNSYLGICECITCELLPLHIILL